MTVDIDIFLAIPSLYYICMCPPARLPAWLADRSHHAPLRNLCALVAANQLGLVMLVCSGAAQRGPAAAPGMSPAACLRFVRAQLIISKKAWTFSLRIGLFSFPDADYIMIYAK